ARHYPLYLQQRLAMLPEEARGPSALAGPGTFFPLSTYVDKLVRDEAVRVTRLVTSKFDLDQAVSRYQRDTIMLLLLTIVFGVRLYVLRQLSLVRLRRYWSRFVTTTLAVLLVFNSFYWIIGYSTLLRTKNFPRVSVSLKKDHRLSAADAD